MNEQEGNEKRRRSYRSGARIAKQRMAREAPLDAEALAAVEASDVVVLPGAYDHVDRVLEALEMPFTRVGSAHLGAVELRPEQLLVVKLPWSTRLARRAPDPRLRDCGRQSVHHRLGAPPRAGAGLPGRARVQRSPDRRRRGPRRDPRRREPVPARRDRSGRGPAVVARGLLVPDPGPRSSVEVLLASTELQGKYGEAPVAVLFRQGQGEVFHMISHYYLQRTELREARHRSSSVEYAMAKGVAASPDMADLTTGEVESAASSARLLANAVARKKRRVAERAKDGGADA